MGSKEIEQRIHLPNLDVIRTDIGEIHPCVYRTLPDELVVDYVEAYIHGGDNARAAQRGMAELLAPIHAISEDAWTLIEPGLEQAYFVHTYNPKHALHMSSLYAVVPLGDRFLSLELFKGMFKAPYERLDGGRHLRNGYEKLPEFLHPLMSVAAMGGINFKSPYLQIADVRWYYGVGMEGKGDMHSEFRGAKRNKVKALFGADWQWNLYMVARDDKHNWTIFVDKGEAGDRTLFVALDPQFRDVRRLGDARAAYSAMLVHYLSGHNEPVDLAPFTVGAKIW